MALATQQQLAETRSSTTLPATIAIYWHLLSFDAPTIAALWSWSFARATHLALPLMAPMLLAAGTWLVYVADRLLDGMDSRNRAQLRERHYFYVQHRMAFLIAGAVAAPVFLWIVFTRMAPEARHEDSAIFIIAAIYFLLVHLHGRRAERWLPKELAVGILFSIATAVPAWARLSMGQRLQISPAVALFAALCWLNCVAIETWERLPFSETPHWTTLWAGNQLSNLSACIAVLALLPIGLYCHDEAFVCLYLATALAAGFFRWLIRTENRLTAMQRRVAVDAVLLTPLLFLAWLR